MRTSNSKYLKEAKAAQNKGYNWESTHFQLLPHCSQYPKHGTSLDGQQQRTDREMWYKVTVEFDSARKKE